MTTKTLHPWARYRRAAGFTQSSAADTVGVTRRYMIWLEQSLYWHPPDTLLVKLASLYSVELGIFEESYYSFVRSTREEFSKRYGRFEVFFPKPYQYKKHPLVFYRDAYELSRLGLCKGLCLHYDPISEWEQNKQRAIPEQLVEACEEINWSWQAIERAVADWRSSGRADEAKTIHR